MTIFYQASKIYTTSPSLVEKFNFTATEPYRLQPEFDYDVRTAYSPFRTEFGHRLAVREAFHQFDIAEEKLKAYWQSLAENGIAQATMMAEFTGSPQVARSRQADGSNFEYIVRLKGQHLDNFSQPVDIFRLSKPEGAIFEGPDSITLATFSNANNRFSRLVSLSVQAGDSVFKFHYVKGKLIFLEEVEDEDTFVRVVRGGIHPRYGDPLVFYAGRKKYHPLTNHIYRNIGDNTFKTQRLRVVDPLAGAVEIFSVGQDGVVQTAPVIEIPQAIMNIANLSDALTA